MLKKFLTVFFAIGLLAACSHDKPGEGSNLGGGGTNGGAMNPGGVSVENATPDENGMISIGDRVFFDYDSSVLSSEAQATLSKQSQFLQKNSSLNVTIEGHCDERGTREYNLALGERRATAVKNYLVSLGIPNGRLTTISYGKEHPEVLGSDESAFAKNRRGVTVVNP